MLTFFARQNFCVLNCSIISVFVIESHKILNYIVYVFSYNCSTFVKGSIVLSNYTHIRDLPFKERYDFSINILSLFEDKLLISQRYSSELFIYHQEGYHLSTIQVKGLIIFLSDAIWTPYGNILYAMLDNVVLISEKGKSIKQTEMSKPMDFSVSSDDIIYVTLSDDASSFVQQSLDGGISWSLVFKSRSWNFFYLTKVTSDHGDTFWTYGCNLRNVEEVKLREHSAKNINSDGEVTRWKEYDSGIVWTLSSDGNAYIFITIVGYLKVIVMSTNWSKPHSLIKTTDYAGSTVVDTQNKILYVGRNNKISVFKLNYL